jgi:DNA-directed RNA polymerase subunit N (RpoN/RPB10)
MLIPIRCTVCNTCIGSRYKKYKEIIATEPNKENIITGNPDDIDTSVENIYQKAFREIGIVRYCCKRHLISHIDLIDKI